MAGCTKPLWRDQCQRTDRPGTAAEQNIFIRNIHNGQTLSGEVMLEILAANIDDSVDELSVFVDGCSLGCAKRWPQPDGVWPHVFSLSTYWDANGEHRLRASAAPEVFHEVFVTFQNVVFDYRCDGMYDSQGKAFVSAKIVPPQAWRIEISSLYDVVVRVFTGVGNAVDIQWDGTDAHGSPVRHGTYNMRLSLLETKEIIREYLIVSYD